MCDNPGLTKCEMVTQEKKKKAKPDRSFSKFVSKILKMYMELPVKRCKAETLLKYFLKKRLNYPFSFDI